MSHGSRNGRFSNLFWGITLIIVGLVFLGQRYNWFGLGIDLGLDKIWPVFIIIAGLIVVLKNRRG